MNILDWAPGLCARLNIDEPGDVDTALSLWAASEGMPDWANNVLAASDKITGSKQYNSAGVQSYPSISAMLDLYASKLLSDKYRGIFDALDNGTVLDIYHAINKSAWCPGCTGGNYPGQLHQFLVATGALPGADFVALFNNPPGQTGPAPEAWDLQIVAAHASMEHLAKETARHYDALRGLKY